MAMPKPKPAVIKARYKALIKANGNQCQAATAHGCSRFSIQDAKRLVEADPQAYGFKPSDIEISAPSPMEVQDAEFWRRKYKALEKEKQDMHAVVRAVGVLDGLKVGKPKWVRPRKSKKKGLRWGIIHNSDRHIGEVVEPDEVQGYNGYNLEIAERRINRFIDASCDLVRRWTPDDTVEGILYTMGGDDVSGDIHDELTATNEVTSLEAVHEAVKLHVAGLQRVVEEFGRVHVAAVPGNHGRITKKSSAKKYGALSYDTMIARLAARELSDDSRITWDIASGPDVVVPMLGWNILVTHGDKIGTGGGKGFAGPVLPIIRGSMQVRAQYARAGTPIDLILMGHYHTSAQPPGVLSNGSVVGMSEFGFGIRGTPDVPRQWCALMGQRWGLIERVDVQLEDPLHRAMVG